MNTKYVDMGYRDRKEKRKGKKERYIKERQKIKIEKEIDKIDRKGKQKIEIEKRDR